MQDMQLGAASPISGSFVETHCRTCAYGATITRVADGKKATFCLLMRDWMTSKRGEPLIADCDSYEPEHLEQKTR
jgi:hypothetical protein